MSPSASISPPKAASGVLLVGGGLQAGLIALALLEAAPELPLTLVERDERLGGEHTWCFHAADVPTAARAFVEPLVEWAWPGYDVRFPNLARHVSSPYRGLSSERFDRVLRERFERAPAAQLHLGRTAASVDASGAELEDGERLEADLVIDARGPLLEGHRGRAGFQTFFGIELRTAAPHGLAHPIVMDARVAQLDGFRFMYVLPMGPDRLLVEDTRFADTEQLDVERAREAIEAYVEARGWTIAEPLREERGVLPMTWSGTWPARPAGGPLLAGYRGGWLHPATGYSFPTALRLALGVAAAVRDQHLDTASVTAALAPLARRHRSALRFAEVLNRLLFRWFAPEDRVHVFERFYKLPDDLTRRFYALEASRMDQLRLLGGRPPRGFSPRARLSSRRRIHA